MSSTKRGGQRTESDNYPSPPWCPDRLWDRVTLPDEGLWVEPCAGDGAIIQAAKARGMKQRWWAIELREEERPKLEAVVRPDGSVVIGDYLSADMHLPPRELVTVVITNPPYRIAWEVLHKSLREFPTAYIVLLLRVNFIASQGRYGFMSKYMPDLYVLPNRPGFKGWGKTDSPEYGWFLWGPSPRARTRGEYELLDLTSKEERKRVPDAPIIVP